MVAAWALALSGPAVAWETEKARVITRDAKPMECISRVSVRQVDGREAFVSPQQFYLDPGRHSLSGTVALDTRYCPVGPGNEYAAVAPLEADFEAGKTYFLGFDHSAPDRAEWSLVVWKVE